MRRAIVLQHVPIEGPGRLGQALRRCEFELDTRRLDRGEPVPESIAPGDVLVVMGGPMGVGDLGSPELPFLTAEVALLRRCLADGTPLVGVCLGSQLLAHAAGARVYPATRPAATPGAAAERVYEVGWAPVDFHGVDREPVLRGLPPRAEMLHWHGDTFDLPAGAVHLASTPACPNQAFRLGERAFGFQFHCEVDGEMIAAFVAADGDYVALANGPGGAERIRRDTARNLARFEEVGGRLVTNVAAELAAASASAARA